MTHALVPQTQRVPQTFGRQYHLWSPKRIIYTSNSEIYFRFPKDSIFEWNTERESMKRAFKELSTRRWSKRLQKTLLPQSPDLRR